MKYKRLTPFGSSSSASSRLQGEQAHHPVLDAPADLQQSRATSIRRYLGQNILLLGQVAANEPRCPPPLIQEKILWLPGQTAPEHQRSEGSSIASKLAQVLYQRKHVRHERSSYRRRCRRHKSPTVGPHIPPSLPDHLRDDEDGPSCSEVEKEAEIRLCYP